MSETNSESISEPPDPAPFTLALIGGAFAFAVATAIEPDLVWVFGFAFATLAMVCWRGLKPTYRSPLSRDYARKAKSTEASRARNAVVEAMQHPVFIVDATASLLFANSASQKVFGVITKGEQIFIRFRQPELRRVIEGVLKTGRPGEIEYHEPVPRDRWFAVEISPVSNSAKGQAKRDRRFIISFLDLTETKKIDQMRSDFIANASHELRTPLASLVGYLETLEGPAKNDPKATARFLGIMLGQAERMSRLVNDLLSLSRIEMKSHVRPDEMVDLSEVVATVINALEPLAKSMEIQIERSLHPEIMIRGDRDELVQVFQNIIENACKYGQDGGEVRVDLNKRAGEHGKEFARVSVTDFGPGIAIEHQHRITERFYRIDVARSREKQGTGLGLAIVKHILQRHGTRLQVASKPGEGASFKVDFETETSVKKS